MASVRGSGRAARSGRDALHVPGSPEPDLVAGADPDLVGHATMPAHAVAGGGRRPPRVPGTTDASPLDLEVAETGSQHLEASVIALPADSDALMGRADRLLVGPAEAGPRSGVVGQLGEHPGEIELAVGGHARAEPDVVVAGGEHD